MSHFIPNIDNNAVDFLREESVYIEENYHMQKNSQPINIEELNRQPKSTSSSNNVDNSVKRNSSRIKWHKEKDSRWVAEQTTRMHERFDLSTEDQLLASCSAALLKKILLQGRLYITTHHIFFYTNIFGKVTREAFPYISLAQVEKRRGGLVANAIKLQFADENVSPIIIGSLNHREKVFNLIQERLQALNPTALEAGSAGAKTTSISARNTLATTLSRPSLQSSASSEIFVHAVVNPSQEDKIEVGSTETVNLTSKSQASEASVTTKINLSAPIEQMHTKEEECLRSVVWYTDNDTIGIFLTNSYQKKTERARIVLNAPVREVFNVLYISDWLKEYHQEVQNYDVEMSEWHRDETGRMCRDVLFKRPLSIRLGPKETRVQEKHWISYTEQDSVVIEVEGRSIDVPYSNYFVVHSFFEMSPMNNCRDTLLVASVAVEFSKSTMLQGQIESGALSQTKTAFGKLVTLARQRIDNHLLKRAVSCKVSKPSIRMNQEQTGPILEHDESVRKRSFEAEGRASLKNVVGELSVTTYENDKHRFVASPGMASAGNHNPDAQSEAPVDIVCHTVTKQDGTNIIYSYIAALVLVVFVVCALLVILMIRVELLVGSLEELFVKLESGRRC